MIFTFKRIRKKLDKLEKELDENSRTLKETDPVIFEVDKHNWRALSIKQVKVLVNIYCRLKFTKRQKEEIKKIFKEFNYEETI